MLQKLPVLVEQSCFEYLVPQTPQNTPARRQMEGGREAGRQGGERERERGDKGSMIVTVNTSSAGLLASVVLALYYVFHAVRDGMHRELTVLWKLPSPCIAELLRVSSLTNSSSTSAHRANGDFRGHDRSNTKRLPAFNVRALVWYPDPTYKITRMRLSHALVEKKGLVQNYTLTRALEF